MNKQKNILNMSLIPLVIIVVLILGAGYFLLQDEINLPKFNKGPQIRRLEGFPTVIYTDKPLEKQRKVISSEQELNEFLNYMDETGLLTVKESINFNKEYVLAVSTDLNEETEHYLKVKKLYEDKEDKTLLVMVEERELDERCPTDKDTNVVLDLVVVSKTDYNIEFDREKKTVLCDEVEEMEEETNDGSKESSNSEDTNN